MNSALLVAGWVLFGTIPGFNTVMLPGGMLPAGAGHFIMIPPGWVVFVGTPPL